MSPGFFFYKKGTIITYQKRTHTEIKMPLLLGGVKPVKPGFCGRLYVVDDNKRNNDNPV